MVQINNKYYMNRERHFCLDESPHFHMMELDTIDSTNNFLKKYRPPRPCRMTLATAEFQTNGRGADTNSWESAYGNNLLFSLLTYPQAVPASRVFVLSEVLALSVHHALNEFASGFSIKWPNDIYHADRKVAGLLIENDIAGKNIQRSVMGVGININQSEFLSDAPNPVSLKQIMGEEVERRFVLESVMEHFTRYYQMVERGEHDSIHKEYLEHLYRWQEPHLFEDEQGVFKAAIKDVEADGHLILTDENGMDRRYAFKEVKFIIK